MSVAKDRRFCVAYPSFSKSYIVETDASISVLGAVLSQMQQDRKLHLVAYASMSLSAAERNYCVTELEILAVVWALTVSTLTCMAISDGRHRSCCS